MSRRVFVVAGEISGDAHAAWLLHELGGQVGALEVRGVGGPEMVRRVGEGIRDWVDRAAVMGVWEVLKNYAWFRTQFFQILAEAKQFQPDVLLLVDYPGFNLRFAQAVRKALPRTRIVYYVCPQVWAWNKRRIPKMARILDEVLCLFPFEPILFEKTSLKATFVGHPIVDELEDKRMAGAVRHHRLVGLFPGSREREIARLLPALLDVVKRMRERDAELCFEIPAATPALSAEIVRMVDRAGLQGHVQVTDGGSHALMQRADCAVIASGTATLEAAYYGLPYCLVYRVAPLTYRMAKWLVKIRWIGIVNILAGREVVREFVQDDVEGASIADELFRLRDDQNYRATMVSAMAQAVSLLGGTGAHARAAGAVARWMVQ